MSQPQLPSIEDLNRSSPEEFLHNVNVLFETAPPLSKVLLQSRPYSSYQSLIDTADQFISEMNPESRLEVSSFFILFRSNKEY